MFVSTQGLTTYFDVYFSHCHLEVKFSTGPASPRTHWQQTTFHLRKNYCLAHSEVIRGIFRMNRNQRCERDLDFMIGFIVEVSKSCFICSPMMKCLERHHIVRGKLLPTQVRGQQEDLNNESATNQAYVKICYVYSLDAWFVIHLLNI